VIAVRYAALAALALWVGSTSALGLFVAPALDRAVPVSDTALAAAVESVRSEIFWLFHLLSYVCGAVVFASLMVIKFVGPPPASFKARVALVSLMLAAAAYSGLPLDREIRGLRSTIPGPVGGLPESDPRRVRLDRLQRIDMTLMSANIALGAVLLFWYVRE
jgi:hypothetical protein